MDIEAAEREKLQAVFPQCFVEGKLDIDKLLNLCGEYITNDSEKYEFRWKGKSECLQLAGKRSTGTLRPCPQESVDWENTRNIYIEGDNLEVLKLLQTSYYRKVKMIYIDPPYNTGNDFVYEDNFAAPMKRYLEVTQQTTKSNPESMGRFHTNWLNMMYPRLRLAANLLRDDGVIFISIDDNEVHNLRKVCDEVFGEENFVSNVIWEKKFSPQNDAKWFSDNHDHILIYAKNKNEWYPNKLERTEESNNRFSNPDNDPRGAWASSDMTVRTYSADYDYPITTPGGREVMPTQGRCWSMPQHRVKELIADNRIWFGKDGNNVPRIKTFLSEVDGSGIVPLTIWKYADVGHNQEARQELKKLFDNAGYFDSPKPVRLLAHILKLSIGKDDIIFDFFSGSATTAHAVMQLNAEDGGSRQYIMVQLPEPCDKGSEALKAGYKNICEIGKERIRRAGAKIKTEQNGQQLTIGEPEKAPLDIGFRVFKLDTSNLKIWDDSPITGENAVTEFERRIFDYLDVLVPDRSDVDVVYEVMLKLGQDLCEPIRVIELDGKRKVYAIGKDTNFIICLAPHITAEDAEKMAQYAPKKIVFAEQCFDGSTTDKSNVRLTLKDKGIEIKTL